MAIYLYCRVSTDKQHTDSQEQDLKARFPDGTIVRETASGAKTRPELEKLLERLQKGDTIAVVALDRLGRKLTEILLRLDDLHRRGINVVSLREKVDYSTPAGKFTVHAFCMMAELERGLISERTKAALQALKARGVRLGHAPIFTEDQIAKAIKLRHRGRCLREIAKVTGIGKTRLCEIFAERGIEKLYGR